MSPATDCANCGARVPADAETCPLCMLRLGLSPASIDASGSRPAPPAPDEIAGHFPQLEILGLLGQGGMGVVYKARQRQLDRTVALKILSPGVAGDPDFRQRFLREARALARLSHPNIVAVFDFGETDGICWLLMEYVDGVDLRGLLKSGQLAPEVGLQLVPEMCEGLQYAHDQGVVHRDIKPENVLLDQDGHVKIADFGLAKLLSSGSEGAADLTMTRSEQVMGTLRYMAPEQMENTKHVDHRADIYSLGVMFYEMLTGDLPAGRFESPSERVSVDVRVDQIVLRALARDPERRYQHARDIKSDVETVRKERELVEGPAPVRQGSSNADRAVGRGYALFMGASVSLAAWTLIQWMFVFGIGGLKFSGLWGLGASGVLLATVAGFILWLRLRSDPELRDELASSGRLLSFTRRTVSAALFGLGMMLLFSGLVESWDRSTSSYVSSRTDHRLMTLWDDAEIQELLSSLDQRSRGISAFNLSWGSHEGNGVATGFRLSHRIAWINTLFASLICMSVFVLPLVATKTLPENWPRCWRHVLAVPLTLFFGLALLVGIRWLTTLDDPALEMQAINRQWRVEAGIDSVREELETFLAEENFDLHSRLLGSVRGEDDRELLAFHDLLGAQPASRLDRWRLSLDGPVRKLPHLLLKLTGDIDQQTCVIRLDAGLLREDMRSERFRWELWLKQIQSRLEALEA